MAERPKPGSIVHVEFHVKEPKKVEKFYGTLFGGKFTPVPGMDYSLFEAPRGPPGGVVRLQPEKRQEGVLNDILANTVAHHVKRTEKARGQALTPNMEVPSLG